MRLSYPHIALHIPKILLPRRDVALDRWAVIACDQHTSFPQYWQEVEEFVADNPSTLRLMFPEVYLGQPDSRKRLKQINCRMHGYLEDGLLEEQPAGFVLVNRRTSHSSSRKGLLVCLDLECYGEKDSDEALIRTTEKTDPERLPPRIEARRSAPLEVPHIMVLIDDPGNTVIEPLFECCDELPLLYDFELMMGGGHIQGWHVRETESIRMVVDSLSNLVNGSSARHEAASNKAPMLYAMGDGNHSFATACGIWKELKKEGAPANHPARYALVEIVNLHDEGLKFEPIHRVVFDVDVRHLLASFSDHCRSKGSDLELSEFKDRHQWEKASGEFNDHVLRLPFVAGSRLGIATIHRPQQQLAVAALQHFLNDCDVAYRVDYIHGREMVDKLGCRDGNVGFYTGVLDKRSLFNTILLDGPLPRKSFSLGEAEEKRYYLESRRIVI